MARSRTVLEPLSAECATDGMAESNEWLSVGKIVGVQGLRGLRVNPASVSTVGTGPRWLRSRKGGEPTEIQLRRGGNAASRCSWFGLKESTAVAPPKPLWARNCWCQRMTGPNWTREFHLLDLWAWRHGSRPMALPSAP